jgi:hypothetical protein
VWLDEPLHRGQLGHRSAEVAAAPVAPGIEFLMDVKRRRGS